MIEVRFNKGALTITMIDKTRKDEPTIYEMDLELVTDPAEVIDWIYHLMGKQWATPQVIYDFLKVFDDACGDIFNARAKEVFDRRLDNICWSAGCY